MLEMTRRARCPSHRILENTMRKTFACGIMCRNQKFLVYRRNNGTWSFPGGKVEDQDLFEAARTNRDVFRVAVEREFEEETGIRVNYSSRSHTMEVNGVKGQDWFGVVFYVMGSGRPELREPCVFTEFKWATKEELLLLPSYSLSLK